MSRLREIPEAWSSSVSPELLVSCHETTAIAESLRPPDGTTFRRLGLRCEPARASVLGPRAYRVQSPAAFFLCLGWTPIVYFDTIACMRAPEGWSGQLELWVPVPHDEPLLDFAMEIASQGVAWSGTAWNWPASFEPMRFSKQWSDANVSTLLWDGRDAHGNPTAGTVSKDVPAGWHRQAAAANFRIGFPALWNRRFRWDLWPESNIAEDDARLG